MADEKISVVVAVYNAEKFLNKCIESIVNQGYKNLQIILVDDGSKDSSLEICKGFETRDSRIEIVHKENGGLTSARKAGFDVAQGGYIVFLDSDDFLEKDYIDKLYQSIVNNNSDIAICGYYLDKGEVSSKILLKHSKDVYEKNEFLDNLILPGIFPMQNDETRILNFMWLRMYKKSIITDKCFVSEREVYTEDLFFNLSAYDNCNRVSIVDACLYHYVENPNSLTHIYRSNKYDMEMQRIKQISAYLEEKGIDHSERIQRVGLRAIWECIDNAMGIGSYSAFAKDIKKLYQTEKLRELNIQVVLGQATKTEVICYFCFKYKLIFTTYLFKKIVGLLKRI